MAARKRVVLATALCLVFGLVQLLPGVTPSAGAVNTFTATVASGNNVTLTWNVGTLPSTSKIYIYNLSDEASDVVGYKPYNATSATFREAGIGLQRYVLTVFNSSDVAQFTLTASAMINSPGIPTITSSNFFRVDLNPSPVTFTWTSPTAAVRVVEPSGATSYVTTGTFTVTSFPHGRNTYKLASCVDSLVVHVAYLGDPQHLCGEDVLVTIDSGVQRFNGDYRTLVAGGSSQTVSWTSGPSSNAWYILTSNIPGWSPPAQTGTSISVPIPSAAGVYDIALTSCRFYSGFLATCANNEPAPAGATGLFTPTAAANSVVKAPDEIGTVAMSGGGTFSVKAGHAGTITNLSAANTAVTPSTSVGNVITDQIDHKQFVVGSTTSWTSRPYTTDFTVISDMNEGLAPGTGFPLDVVAKSSTSVFSIGENHTALSEGASGTIVPHDVPLKRKVVHDAGRNADFLQRVAPFANVVNSAPSSTANSNLGEKVLTTPDGKVWFTQGGHFQLKGTGNHSRIVSYDPSLTNTSTTVDDNRFCAYDVPVASPTDDDTQAIGLAWDPVHHRMWFSEGMGGRVDSFDPATMTPVCGPSTFLNDPSTFYDYSQPTYNPPFGYCSPATSQGPNCFQSIQVPQVGPNIPYPAHLVFDPSTGSAGSIWFNEYFSNALTRVDLATNTIPSGSAGRIVLPASVRPQTLQLGTLPWQLVVDANYVYVAETGDGAIARYHKTGARAGQVDVVELPFASNDMGGHSIELGTGKNAGRLFFSLPTTMSVVTPNISTLGYIDVTSASWPDAQASPSTGVLYTGMGSIVGPGRVGISAGSMSEFSFTPSGDAIAVTDYSRRQVIVLGVK